MCFIDQFPVLFCQNVLSSVLRSIWYSHQGYNLEGLKQSEPTDSACSTHASSRGISWIGAQTRFITQAIIGTFFFTRSTWFNTCRVALGYPLRLTDSFLYCWCYWFYLNFTESDKYISNVSEFAHELVILKRSRSGKAVILEWTVPRTIYKWYNLNNYEEFKWSINLYIYNQKSIIKI